MAAAGADVVRPRWLPDRVAGDPGERTPALLAGAPSAERMPMKPALRTAAGVIAGRHLALSLVEEDLGRVVALARRRAAPAGRARCGFAKADTLRRAFARHVGVTPAAYRKQRLRRGDGSAARRDMRQ